ncbi:Hypothetical protein NTJ_07117 [Nesidiocoris tenuis]|uniref:Uncharacterized protein n=1 Tax=Nesidiocoris tenuis TaxID=355587 RepID=A0ABN7AQI9_9HEMI|nr:Hypothetical protein NTJ_07117 [Nesidiocoris tenuis]
MEVLCVIYAPLNSTQENTIPLNIGREPTLPPLRRAALPEPEPGGAEPGNPSPSINDITSRPARLSKPKALRFRVSTTRAHVRLCNFMFGYPASANRLFAASVFRRLPSGSVASRSRK